MDVPTPGRAGGLQAELSVLAPGPGALMTNCSGRGAAGQALKRSSPPTEGMTLSEEEPALSFTIAAAVCMAPQLPAPSPHTPCEDMAPLFRQITASWPAKNPRGSPSEFLQTSSPSSVRGFISQTGQTVGPQPSACSDKAPESLAKGHPEPAHATAAPPACFSAASHRRAEQP